MLMFFFFNDTATTEIYSLSLHDALPILPKALLVAESVAVGGVTPVPVSDTDCGLPGASSVMVTVAVRAPVAARGKVHVMTQLAAAATEPASAGHEVTSATAKSAACRPEIATPMTMNC